MSNGKGRDKYCLDTDEKRASWLALKGKNGKEKERSRAQISIRIYPP